MKTIQLRNKVTVLAKEDQFGINPYTYTNDTQASKKQIQLQSQGVQCSVYSPWGSRVKYIQIF